MNTYTFPNQKQTFFEMVQNSFRFMFHNFKEVFPLLALLFILKYASYLFFTKIGMNIEVMKKISIIMNEIINLTFFTAIIYRIHCFSEGSRVNILETLSFGFSKIPTNFFIILLMLLFLTPLIYIASLILMLKGNFGFYFSYLVIFLYISFVIVKLALTPILVVTENSGPWDSIEKSSELISGNFLRTFFLLCVLLCVVFIIGFILNFVGHWVDYCLGAKLSKWSLYGFITYYSLIDVLGTYIFLNFLYVAFKEYRVRLTLSERN